MVNPFYRQTSPEYFTFYVTCFQIAHGIDDMDA